MSVADARAVKILSKGFPEFAKVKKECCYCSNLCHPGMLCGGCGIARYCAPAACQKLDWPDHKKSCQGIQKRRKEVAAATAKLLELCDGDEERLEKLKNDQVGNYWQFPEGRQYCLAVFDLANDLMRVAVNSERFVYDPPGMLGMLEAERLFLELMRLCEEDKLGVRYWYPSVLLALDRMEDAFHFIYWWATVERDENGRLLNHAKCWNEIKKGEWIYSGDEDLLEDILDDCRVDRRSLQAYDLLALVVVKAWVILQLKAGFKVPKDFSPTYPWPVQDCIDDQESMFVQYCALLAKKNQFILKGILEADPRLWLKKPCSTLPRIGSVEEAQGLVVMMLGALQKFDIHKKLAGLVDSIEFMTEMFSTSPEDPPRGA